MPRSAAAAAASSWGGALQAAGNMRRPAAAAAASMLGGERQLAATGSMQVVPEAPRRAVCTLLRRVAEMARAARRCTAGSLQCRQHDVSVSGCAQAQTKSMHLLAALHRLCAAAVPRNIAWSVLSIPTTYESVKVLKHDTPQLQNFTSRHRYGRQHRRCLTCAAHMADAQQHPTPYQLQNF